MKCNVYDRVERPNLDDRGKNAIVESEQETIPLYVRDDPLSGL